MINDTKPIFLPQATKSPYIETGDHEHFLKPGDPSLREEGLADRRIQILSYFKQHIQFGELEKR